MFKKTRDWNNRKENFLVYTKQFFLYKPFSTRVILYLVCSILFYVLVRVFNSIPNASIQLAGKILGFIIYFCITISLIKRIPRPLVEYEETWKTTLAYYLEESKINKKYHSQSEKYKEAKYRLRTATRYYRQKGEFLLFFINLLWGGIFVGCLPDKDFQQSLMTLSIFKIFDANPFGLVCILLLPIMSLYYFRTSGLPAIWIQQIVD
jgi:hypothetical protein